MNDDGGPAFPCEGFVSSLGRNVPHAVLSGMTLRDYFAGQYIAGYMAGPTTFPTREEASAQAYLMADAMLKARQA